LDKGFIVVVVRGIKIILEGHDGVRTYGFITDYFLQLFNSIDLPET